jgi:peptidoglycan/LPS O-acetylase OafA/YrhL
MVTGFLFWKKAIDGHGRVDFRRLYVGRLRRLVPLYYVAIAFTFAYAGARTGWTLQVPPRNLVGSLARWGTFGLLGMQYPVNAFHDTWATNTAVWTLSYEWAFYLVLPALSWFAFPRRFAWLALPMLAATFLYPDRLGVVSNFVFGMAAAHVVHADLWARARASVWTPIAAVVGVLLLTRLAYSEYGFLQSLALFPAFLCVVSRNPACGFLEWRAARAIGTVSYSLYLLHCPVLYGFFYSLEGVANVGGMSASRYWAIMCGVVPAIVALSFLTYRWVEWPGLTLWPPRRLAEGAPAAGAR